MKKYGKFAALIAVVVGTLAWLATTGMNQTKTYYKTISELGQQIAHLHPRQRKAGDRRRAGRHQRRARQGRPPPGHRPYHSVPKSERIRTVAAGPNCHGNKGVMSDFLGESPRIALDATYSVGDGLSGVGLYSREMLLGLAAAHPEARFDFCYRPHRYWRPGPIRSRPMPGGACSPSRSVRAPPISSMA